MITSYDKLPLGKYLEIIALGKECEDETQYTVSLLAILTDKTENELLDMPLLAFKALSAQLHFLQEEVPLTKVIPAALKFNGREYCPTLDAKKITAAQYIDFNAIQDAGKGNEKENLVESMSCFVIPKGHGYNDGYDMDEVKADIREAMPVALAASLCAFFLNQYANLLNRSLTYSKLMAKMLPKRHPMKEEFLQRWKSLTGIVSQLAGVGSTMSELFRIPHTKIGIWYYR